MAKTHQLNGFTVTEFTGPQTVDSEHDGDRTLFQIDDGAGRLVQLTGAQLRELVSWAQSPQVEAALAHAPKKASKAEAKPE